MYENFPYSNFHDLNTDWLVKKVKDVETSEANAKASEENAKASEIEARASELGASASAQNAEQSAEIARESASDAQGYAIEAGQTVANTLEQIDLLQARVDNIIPSGTQTQGNTELLDIRVEYDGTVASSAGNAVRAQVNKLFDNTLNYRGLTPTAETTLASIGTVGWYTVNDPTHYTDIPAGAEIGALVNIMKTGNTNPLIIRQFYINAFNGKVFSRLLSNGSAYNDWIEYITSTTYNDQISTKTFIYRYTPTGTLLDTNILTGWYSVTTPNNFTDIPDGAGVGALVNLTRTGNTNPAIVRQFYVNAFDSRIWSRLISGGSAYTEWDEIGSNNYDTVWYAIGDSITAGSYSNDEGQGIPATNAKWSYPNRIGRDYKCIVHNLGVPGAQITSFSSQASQVNSDATLVTISGGANDYYGSDTPLGTVNSPVDNTTVCGALKGLIETVANRAPNARIVIVSPIIIKYGTIETKWSLNYASRAGFTYAQLADAMKDICEYYNIEFIDGTREGPTNILNISNVQKDGVHPTIPFYNTYANWIGSKLF